MKHYLKNPFSVLFLFLTICLFVQSCSFNQSGTIAVETGLVYNAGDVKPVARTEFYLLDDDLETILKNAQIPETKLNGVDDNSKMGGVNKLGFWKKFSDLYKTEFPQALVVIKQHSISTMTTDFSGKGSFATIKPGKYWLVGVSGGNQIVIWNLPIEVKGGNQSVTLDNKNAAMIL